MRATIVIPSYWGRSSSEPINLEDSVYDHPTPLDSNGTLGRALESINVLSNRDFNVVVLAAATHPGLYARVEEKVNSIVAPFRKSFPVACLSHSFEAHLKSTHGGAGFEDIVSLTGYSNIRNMCVIAAELAESEVAVLFDDDEVYEDPLYLDKVFENVGREVGGKPLELIAGYYLQPDGGYLVSPGGKWWLAEWPMVRTMNEAFRIIGEGPRLQLTPFVFGGNMVIHRNVFRKIPFDPYVRRGEDIDFLTNCKFFDIDFYLDRELSIRHLPPEKNAPPWQHFRENVYRFIYARAKLAAQSPGEGMRMVGLEELAPYPASCMGDDLEDLVFKTSVLIGMKCLEENDELGFTESMRNIYLARYDAAPEFDPYKYFIDYQKRWARFMSALSEDRESSMKLLEAMDG
ncbi:MAG: hypothetical protein JXA49_00310 [Actinobacteria bacterium]|nr:hypothetical protein [Actinomycetota bacterium]